MKTLLSAILILWDIRLDIWEFGFECAHFFLSDDVSLCRQAKITEFQAQSDNQGQVTKYRCLPSTWGKVSGTCAFLPGSHTVVWRSLAECQVNP